MAIRIVVPYQNDWKRTRPVKAAEVSKIITLDNNSIHWLDDSGNEAESLNILNWYAKEYGKPRVLAWQTERL